MKTEIKPVWNVYEYSHNDNEMRVFNVFNHSSFNHNVEKILKQDTTKEEFSELLRRQILLLVKGGVGVCYNRFESTYWSKRFRANIERVLFEENKCGSPMPIHTC